MNLQASIAIYGGGPGSGCNPEVAQPRCGRPEGAAGQQEAVTTSRNFTLPNGNSISVSYDPKVQDAQLESIRQKELAALPEAVRAGLNRGMDTATIFTKDGMWTAARLDLHRSIIDSYLQGHRPQANPEIILTGGGTASGKSMASKDAMNTLADAVYVNPDDLRAKLPEYGAFLGVSMHPLNDEAGYIRDSLILAARSRGYNIVLDGVGSPGTAMHLDNLEAQGYKVGYYFTYRSVDDAVPSATQRAYTTDNLADLRKVPESATRDAHTKARLSFPLLAKPNRELKVYSCCAPGHKKIVYWRDSNGQVRTYDEAGIREVTDGGKEKIDKSFFTR